MKTLIVFWNKFKIECLIVCAIISVLFALEMGFRKRQLRDEKQYEWNEMAQENINVGLTRTEVDNILGTPYSMKKSITGNGNCLVCKYSSDGKVALFNVATITYVDGVVSEVQLYFHDF